MKFCQYCGMPLDDTARFCIRCGRMVPQQPVQPAPQQVQQPVQPAPQQVQQPVSFEYQPFYPVQPVPMPAPVPQVEPAPEPQPPKTIDPPKSRRFRWWSVLLIVLACLIVFTGVSGAALGIYDAANKGTDKTLSGVWELKIDISNGVEQAVKIKSVKVLGEEVDFDIDTVLLTYNVIFDADGGYSYRHLNSDIEKVSSDIKTSLNSSVIEYYRKKLGDSASIFDVTSHLRQQGKSVDEICDELMSRWDLIELLGKTDFSGKYRFTGKRLYLSKGNKEINALHCVQCETFDNNSIKLLSSVGACPFNVFDDDGFYPCFLTCKGGEIREISEE